MSTLKEKLEGFVKCWKYTNTFTTHEGDDVCITSICLIRPGYNFINIFNGWAACAGFSYICEGTITMEEVELIQGLPDRLTLEGKLDISPDYIPYVTYEIELKYL